MGANCQTLGGIYLIVNIEDSMKIKLTCDILVEVSSCLDVDVIWMLLPLSHGK